MTSDSHCERSDDTPTHERRQDLADSNQEVHYYRGLLERLLDLVAHGDEQAVSRMISVIRSGASHDAILTTLAELSGESNDLDNEISESVDTQNSLSSGQEKQKER